jgi:hypothetical protein
VQTRKQELIEERMQLMGRLEAREKLRASEKALSDNIFQRGVDDAGFGRIRSKGDAALFGGHTTQAMKDKFGITQTRPLADFLPTLTIAAKNLATEMTNHNVQQSDLQGEPSITREHVQNNTSVRQMLGERGIKPEALPPEEDIKKLERRVKTEEKKLEKHAGRLKTTELEAGYLNIASPRFSRKGDRTPKSARRGPLWGTCARRWSRMILRCRSAGLPSWAWANRRLSTPGSIRWPIDRRPSRR